MYIIVWDSQHYLDFAGGSVLKNPPVNAGDMGSIPGMGGSPGEGNRNLLQYSCLGNPMDRGAWWVRVHGVAKSHAFEEGSGPRVLLKSGPGNRVVRPVAPPTWLVSNFLVRPASS